jgi:hypothetical protein
MNDIGAFGMVLDSSVPARLPNIDSISELPQAHLLCLCHECAADDDSADKVFQAFGAEIALMVSPEQGTRKTGPGQKPLAWPLAPPPD